MSDNKTKPYFTSVDSRINFPEMEKKMLESWYRDGVVSDYLSKNSKSKKYFSFLDGPITANNPMGVHHAWGRTYKDLWQRYKNMQGFKQRFQNGFDAQGLWVEVEVEKELGFKTKKDIERYGVAKFVDKCKDRVKKYSEIQTQQSKRLGYFMDWDHSYYTLSDDNNYMIWHFLKVCHNNGWLYKGRESVPWCPRCQTAISQHEMLTEDYKKVTHKAIYFELPVVGKKKEFFLVWTTTPWTLPANIAVAVDKNIDYDLVEGKTGDKYWIAQKAKERLFGKSAKTVKTVKGEKLVDLRYVAPFDYLPAVQEVAKVNRNTFHRVVPTDDRIMPISTTEGTGFVHTAVSAGTEDFKLGKKLGLPLIPVISDDASYLPGFGFLTGKNAKKHPEIILDYLIREDERDGVDWVFDIEDYTHRYPGCWRCKTELVWKVTNEWYIAMDSPSTNFKTQTTNFKKNLTLRERMIRVAKQIEWIPEFGLKRELDWLNNMHDWLISKKNRYWGLCLPIWECTECEHFEVVGGKEDLKKLAVKGWSDFEGKSPHKPQVDGIKLECKKCKGEMSRIEPVGNPWLDAGIVTYSTISKDNKSKPLYKISKKEWRKWFPVDFVTESFPGQFKNWFYSLIAMSTVLENERPFKKVLGFATLFDEKGRPMHKSWGNSIEFNQGADSIGVDVMRWMYVRQKVSDNLLFGHNVANEVRRQFHLKIWNIYNFFTTYANLNNWKPEVKPQKGNMHILDIWIVLRLNQTIGNVTKFLDSFDGANASVEIESFVQDLSNWYIRRSRERALVSAENVNDRNQFLSTTYNCLVKLSLILSPFTPFISDAIFRNLTKDKSVHLKSWPLAKKISNKDLDIVAKMSTVREIVEKGHSERKEKNIPVRQPLAKISVRNSKHNLNGFLKLICDELNVKNSDIKEGAGELSVIFDTKITPELLEEKKTRELIREIQNARKVKGVKMNQMISVTCPWVPNDKSLLLTLKRKTATSDFQIGKFRIQET